MRYLGLALFAEGPSDHRFLPPVLRRTTEELCRRRANDLIEIGPIVPLRSPVQRQDETREVRILEAAREAVSAFHILFVHTDGAGNPEVARRERVEPAIERIAVELDTGPRQVVAVIPVRETEAWALSDGSALRAAFGATHDDRSLGVPTRPGGVEHISDPKQALDRAYLRVVHPPARGKKTAAAFLEAIAERVSLERLREVPAFQRFEGELAGALDHLGYLSSYRYGS